MYSRAKNNSKHAYTEKQKRLAAFKMIGSFLFYQGESDKIEYDEKKDCFVWEYREGIRVSVKGNRFYEFGTEKKGNAIDFLMEYFRYSQYDAIRELLNSRYPVQIYNEEEEELILPAPSGEEDRLRDYLDSKNINKVAYETLLEKNLLYESESGTLVFLGRNEGDIVFGVELEPDDNYSECQGSDKKYPFIWHGKQKIIIFKSPLEFLCFITLWPENWKFNTYIITGSQSLKGIRNYLDTGNNRRRPIFLAMSEQEAENMHKFLKSFYPKSHISPVIPNGDSFEEMLQDFINSKESDGE